MNSPTKLFYGWIIVAVGIVVSCIGMGTLMSLGVFMQPISSDMGWSRTGIAVTSMIGFLAMGFGSFFWGTLSDRYGARLVVFSGGVLLGLGLFVTSRATQLVEFQFMFGISVGLAAGSFYVPLTAMTVRWFTHNRSLAVALVSVGLGLGTTIMAPLSRWIMLQHDWRFTLQVLSVMSWAVILPASLLLREPAAIARAAGSTAGRSTLVPEMSLGRALRTSQFFAISLAFFGCCAAHSGPIFHMVPNAVDCGVPDMAAASILSLAGLSGLVGRIICGMLADRIGAKHTLVAGLALQAIAVSLYLMTRSLEQFYAVAIIFGFAYGGVMPLYAILVRENFPARIMGSVFGVVAMVSTFGMAIGPWLGGWLFDAFGGYNWMYLVSFFFGLSGMAIAMTLRPMPTARPPVVHAA